VTVFRIVLDISKIIIHAFAGKKQGRGKISVREEEGNRRSKLAGAKVDLSIAFTRQCEYCRVNAIVKSFFPS
jgi:hypothetical protein